MVVCAASPQTQVESTTTQDEMTCTASTANTDPKAEMVADGSKSWANSARIEEAAVRQVQTLAISTCDMHESSQHTSASPGRQCL